MFSSCTFHSVDMELDRDKTQLFMPPPFFEREEDAFLSMPAEVIRDMSCNRKITDDQESITLMLKQDSLDNLVACDPETKTIDKGDYASSQPKYLILLGKDITIDPETLSNFIKQHMENSTNDKNR